MHYLFEIRGDSVHAWHIAKCADAEEAQAFRTRLAVDASQLDSVRVSIRGAHETPELALEAVDPDSGSITIHMSVMPEYTPEYVSLPLDWSNPLVEEISSAEEYDLLADAYEKRAQAMGLPEAALRGPPALSATNIEKICAEFYAATTKLLGNRSC